MSYPGQDYSRLSGMRVFSDESMETHLKLYKEYVAHFNTMMDVLNGTDRNNPAYDEIKDKFCWNFNGVRLHEAYFGNMTRQFKDLDPESDLAAQMVKTYGSVESWANDFWEVSCTKGEGWAVLAWDPEDKSLLNLWITGHGVGTLFYCVSLLVNDCFDHAYLTDYGDGRADYAEAFLKAIDWAEVEKRFDAVVQLSRAAEYAR
jgi:Fe-Mn family superoxide dismutase